MNELDALYRELILDHSKHPQHFGLPAGDAPAHTGESYQKNPVCGDEITLRARVDNVFNKAYWASAGGYPGSNYLVMGAPRTFVLNASVDF